VDGRRTSWTAHLRAARDLIVAETGDVVEAHRRIDRWVSSDRARLRDDRRAAAGLPLALPRGALRGALRRAVLTRDGYCCVRCTAQRQLTIHHLHPVSAGGSDALANLTTLCLECHDLVEMQRELLAVLRERCYALVAVGTTPPPPRRPIHTRGGFLARVQRARRAASAPPAADRDAAAPHRLAHPDA